jgi:hypothetical protein
VQPSGAAGTTSCGVEELLDDTIELVSERKISLSAFPGLMPLLAMNAPTVPIFPIVVGLAPLTPNAITFGARRFEFLSISDL